MTRTTAIVAALSCCLTLLSDSPTFAAGILSGHPDAISGWTGTVAFDNGSGLNGELDFAVFSAADFNTNFAGLGYVPGDAVVYTYQLINSANPGSDAISAEIVGIASAANTIGTFDIGDVNASSASFIGSNAQWLFNPELGLGQTSWGLAFSSPHGPTSGSAVTIDGGAMVLLNGIPTPVPEPAAVVLIAGCSGLMLLVRRRWR
jgi:hypothetical protein